MQDTRSLDLSDFVFILHFEENYVDILGFLRSAQTFTNSIFHEAGLPCLFNSRKMIQYIP